MFARSIGRAPSRRAFAYLLAAALLPSSLAAQAAPSADEAATARYMERARGNPAALGIFLREMPKGGDLHSHLSGAVYAESYLRWAAEDGLCVYVPRQAIMANACPVAADSLRPAAQIADTSALYNALVDAFSMRHWTPAQGSGHDRFFSTFGRFNSTERRTGDGLAEVQQRAVRGGVRYLELMLTPDGRAARDLGTAAGWTNDFGRMRDTLLALGLRDVVRRSRARLDGVEARRDTVLACGTPRADAGCEATVRWLYQVSRGNAPEQVFAQIFTGFLLAEADPRVVGLNLVQPEDGARSMSDYSLQMRMIQFLRREHPGVRVTLHAGELWRGLVPDEGLKFHVREAVRVAGASRIGHGVDVMMEDSAQELLAEMARNGVMVEINLTSNDVILGVRGADHPLRAYRAAGVPVALSTDDEGVARSEMSREYLRAVQDQGLDYPALKTMARTSLQHAFVDGAPLWRDLPAGRMAAECAPATGGMDGARCRRFVARSPKARLQVELERDFASFERRVAEAERQSR
jgi:adenosine deaminase